jgi:molybdopterin synthase sulfur carrier subunit
MRITVRLFAGARQLAGRDTLILEVGEDATVADLRPALAEACPPLAGLAAQALFASADDYLDDRRRLAECGEVACIPPVSGG